MPPPRKTILRIETLVGKRGGRVNVLSLSCGHWKTARLKEGALPPADAVCIACWVEAQRRQDVEGL